MTLDVAETKEKIKEIDTQMKEKFPQGAYARVTDRKNGTSVAKVPGEIWATLHNSNVGGNGIDIVIQESGSSERVVIPWYEDFEMEDWGFVTEAGGLRFEVCQLLKEGK